jgi:hypothetical protein
MKWSDLYEWLHANHGAEWWNDTVTVYAAGGGEYYPADTIEFEEADDVLNAGSVFLVIWA